MHVGVIVLAILLGAVVGIVGAIIVFAGDCALGGSALDNRRPR